MSLNGKVALITGGGRGIGQAVAFELAKAGADVAVCDLCSEEQAGATLEGVRSAGRQAQFHRVDVSDRSAVEAMFTATLAQFGRIDFLVNNAALNIRKPLVDLEVSDVAKVWDVALWGVFHCTQFAARHMKERGSGSLIMISSIHAEQAYPNNTAYNGAKAAVNHMAKTWAVELAPFGVRVNIVEPGWTNTPGERTLYSEEQIRTMGEELPFRRLAYPSEIAAAVRFLVSDEASYVTGSCLRVDGGISLPKAS